VTIVTLNGLGGRRGLVFGRQHNAATLIGHNMRGMCARREQYFILQ
jgi:hypothetical protein